MIKEENRIFFIEGRGVTYRFRVTPFGHLESLYFGCRLPLSEDAEALSYKRNTGYGSQVNYSETDELYCLDNIPFEWSGIGKGDYRHAPAEIRMPDGSYTCDFVYLSHEIRKGSQELAGLPSAYGADAETLTIHMKDSVLEVYLDLYYTLYEDCDVIVRSTRLVNREKRSLVIRKLMSFSLDLPNRGFRLVTFDGTWIRETHRHERELSYGIWVNDSTTGASSNRHNPGFLLASEGAGGDEGTVYGFNLVYSGNHYGAVELAHSGLVRVMCGINPHCFEWKLEDGESFSSPQAVLCVSGGGYNGLSKKLHDFVNAHIVRGEWKGRERPVLFNNWEGTFFRFNEAKLLRLARRAAAVGCELFVLDDGWFGQRTSDRAGLGDYCVNKRKLPHGLDGLARRVKRRGMSFGLWFEPEMVNPDSELYRAHPKYAVCCPGRKPALGRHQLVLDLTSPQVRDYIVESVSQVLDSAEISYVKWDMNRHISDFYSAGLACQGEFFHRYILGLYEILSRIFTPRPNILLESCSSGGNRFDLGMLCFSPQIWASDDTDPIERLKIQSGLYCLYPQSTTAAHVSSAPHQQTLRNTPLNTRFAVAAFGCLGYELDLAHLNLAERRAVKEQIAWYKAHRASLQYGRLVQERARDGLVRWTVHGSNECITACIYTKTGASDPMEHLQVEGLEPNTAYSVSSRPQPLFIRSFGALINFLLPFSVNPDSALVNLANRLYSMEDARESYVCSGALLACGLPLAGRFSGGYYNKSTRLLGDYGSTLYLITPR